ncbi:MAG: FlgD immunoglobulin-like domain containing protein, partial [bacterium]
MKKLLFAMVMMLVASVSFAVPYGSQIRVSSLSLPNGADQTIDYFLNEGANSVEIKILDATTSAAVATFAGTATLGANSVVWDGTANNAGGSAVPDGSYRVRIKADKTAASAWTVVASNSSVGNYYVPTFGATIYQTLWDGFSGMESLISTDPDLDSFGFILNSTSYVTPRVDGHVVFNPDLSLVDTVTTGQDTILNFPATATLNQAVWGNCFDPADPNYVWVVGQDVGINVMYGRWDDETLQDVTNGVAALANAR